MRPTDTDTAIKTNPHVFLLTDEAEGAPGLRAGRCAACGRHTLGRVPVCAHCLSRDMQEVAAGQRARLIDFSIAHVPAGGFAAPYAIGQVCTDEGLTLFAPLEGDLAALAPGVELAFTTVDAGDGRIGFAYRHDDRGDTR